MKIFSTILSYDSCPYYTWTWIWRWKIRFFFLISVKFSYILNLHTIMCAVRAHKRSKGKLINLRRLVKVYHVIITFQTKTKKILRICNLELISIREKNNLRTILLFVVRGSTYFKLIQYVIYRRRPSWTSAVFFSYAHARIDISYMFMLVKICVPIRNTNVARGEFDWRHGG